MKKYFTLLLFIFSISAACAQQDKISLSKKWTNMLDGAETYTMYKVIKKVELNDFAKNLSDTISAFQKAIQIEKNTVTQQSKEIADLKTNLTNTNANLDQLKQEKDAISFLGISANKYAYLSVLFLIIIVCVVLIVALLVMYKKSQVIAVQKMDYCKKMELEYSDYKQSKFETEKKLKREMQTLFNELEELKRR